MKKRRAWNSSLPAPTAPLARSRIAPRKRSPEETERCHGSPEFRAWMKRQPCGICGRVPSDAAHVKSGGTGRKDDVARTVPLCSDDIRTRYEGHHTEYDNGKRSFVAKYGVDLLALAAETQSRWLAHLGGDA